MVVLRVSGVCVHNTKQRIKNDGRVRADAVVRADLDTVETHYVLFIWVMSKAIGTMPLD